MCKHDTWSGFHGQRYWYNVVMGNGSGYHGLCMVKLWKIINMDVYYE